jgi:hypothetical protein
VVGAVGGGHLVPLVAQPGVITDRARRAHQAAVGLADGGEFVANMVKWRPTLIIKPVPEQLAVALAVASMADSYSANHVVCTER